MRHEIVLTPAKFAELQEELKQLVAELSLANRVLKKTLRGTDTNE